MLEVANEIVLVMFLKDPIARLTQNSLPFCLSKMACKGRKTLASKSEIAVAGVYEL
jgi:hypothetical protein